MRKRRDLPFRRSFLRGMSQDTRIQTVSGAARDAPFRPEPSLGERGGSSARRDRFNSLSREIDVCQSERARLRSSPAVVHRKSLPCTQEAPPRGAAKSGGAAAAGQVRVRAAARPSDHTSSISLPHRRSSFPRRTCRCGRCLREAAGCSAGRKKQGRRQRGEKDRAHVLALRPSIARHSKPNRFTPLSSPAVQQSCGDRRGSTRRQWTSRAEGSRSEQAGSGFGDRPDSRA